MHPVTPAPPFSVARLDHVVLRVADPQAALAFYRDVLGLTLVRRRDDLGLLHLRAGASMVDLLAVDGPLGRAGGPAAGAQARNVDHLCLRIDPFDEAALVAHLARHEVRPLAPVARTFGAEGEGPSLYLRDRDGNTIELKGPSA